jgi:hypothetical protein
MQIYCVDHWSFLSSVIARAFALARSVANVRMGTGVIPVLRGGYVSLGEIAGPRC